MGRWKAKKNRRKDLGVDGIVEGSVQRSGGRVRITAQLINRVNLLTCAGNSGRIAAEKSLLSCNPHEFIIGLLPWNVPLITRL